MATAELLMKIGLCGTKSTVTKSYFTSPLKIGLPKTEGDRLKVVLMMASAGVLKGDAFSYRIHCQPHTKTLITEQSYTKLFDTGDAGAAKTQIITVDEGASLYYCPQAVIPFAGSRFDSAVTIDIKENSELFFTDIVTAGRVGMGERFAFHHYHSRVCVRIDGKPAWIDNCLLEPECMDMRSMLFFDQYTHIGTMYCYHPCAGIAGMEADIKAGIEAGIKAGIEEKVLQMNNKAHVSMRIGASRAVRGVCLRVLAHSAQDIEELFGHAAHFLTEYSASAGIS